MAADCSFSELGFDEGCKQWIDEWINEAISLSEKDDPRLDYICSIVCVKNNGIIIGTIGNTYYKDTQKIGICYGIGTQYRHQVYAAEAVKAYLDHFMEKRK